MRVSKCPLTSPALGVFVLADRSIISGPAAASQRGAQATESEAPLKNLLRCSGGSSLGEHGAKSRRDHEAFRPVPEFCGGHCGALGLPHDCPREESTCFFVRNQDRILYGTDLDLVATADVQETLKDWKLTYARNWKFLATDETLDSNGKKVTGVKLPEAVLHKIFHDNARHWIPGL
jgi:hypothetical protein